MKPTTPLLLLATMALGAPSPHTPRVVGMALERRRIRDPVANDLRRRGVVNVTLDNQEILYFINVSMGSPPQPIRLHVDSGSSDLWLNTPVSPQCAAADAPCAPAGTYSANRSSTYRYVDGQFNISYVDGSGAAGDHATDTLRIGGRDVDDLQFGIGYRSSSPQAILGIGYVANEAQVARHGMPPYRNLPAKMAADGLIASNAYSLWLNDADSPTGSLLFGGVDTARYQGPLVSLPVQKVDGVFVEFFVTLTGLAAAGLPAAAAAAAAAPPIARDTALAVLLDTGSSLTYLPDDMADRVYAAVGATFSRKDAIAYVPCSLRNTDASLTFSFSSPAAIRVPMREMVIDPQELTGQPLTLGRGVPACYFGISRAGNSTSVLGDTFLRSAYVVFDLDNNKISLAQSSLNATTSTIKEIGAGTDAVPDAVPAQNPVPAQSGLPEHQGRGGRQNKDDENGAGVLAPPSMTAAVAIVLMSLVGSVI